MTSHRFLTSELARTPLEHDFGHGEVHHPCSTHEAGSSQFIGGPEKDGLRDQDYRLGSRAGCNGVRTGHPLTVQGEIPPGYSVNCHGDTRKQRESKDKTQGEEKDAVTGWVRVKDCHP